MAIFTSPARMGGRPVDGLKIECEYVGSNGVTRRVVGIIKSQRKVEGKGNLFVVELEGGGFRSIYWEKASRIRYSLPNVKCDGNRYTGEAYDAWKDRQLGGV